MPSIEKRRNGWIVRWRANGQRRSKYFADLKEAQSYAAGRSAPGREMYEALVKGPVKDHGPVLAAYASKLVASSDIAQGSREGYESTLRNHLEGTALGSMQVGRITPQDARDWWAGLSPQKGSGKGMRSNCYILLAKVLNQCVMDGTIDVSPLSRSGIKRPSKRRATEVVPLTVDGVERLAAATTNERDRLLVLVAGYCGLRAGECGGLRVQDIDSARCRITVAQAVVRTRGQKVLSTPKSGKGRTITVPCSLSREVGEFSKQNPPAADSRVFHLQDDGMLDHVTMTKITQDAAKRAGMPPTSAHALRHACASLLVDSGANTTQIAAYLGHTVAVLLSTYSHLFEETGEDLAERMEARRSDYQERLAKLEL